MKKLLLGCAVVLAVVLPGATIASARTSHARNFTANLTGAQETPPVASAGTGRATFQLSGDGTRLHFELTSRGLDRISVAHIHVGAKGVAGSPVAFLFPEAPAAGVDGDGFEVEGTITAVDLVGPLAGHPLADLVADMRAGTTYTNIHTTIHPGGEIRGQIRAL